MTTNINKTSLNRRIRNLAKDHGFKDGVLERLIANLILIKVLKQELADSSEFLIKGGTNFLLRLPTSNARATRDIDLSTNQKRIYFVEALSSLAGKSWRGFSVSRVRHIETPKPARVPQNYLVDQFKITINFGTAQWATCILDVSLDELKVANHHSTVLISEEVQAILEELDFSDLADVPLISTEYQLAQKLHACTQPESRRGQDLYDICVVLETLKVDMSAFSNLVDRVFAFRKTHTLTPIFDPGADFRRAFEAQTKHLEIALDYQEAAEELRGLLALMCAR